MVVWIKYSLLALKAASRR